MLDALLAAGGSILGNIGGGLINHFSNQAANAENREFQMRSMKEGIRWRVDDARAAGVSPLVALGAPTFNPGPVSIADTSMGEAFSRSGQDISRAITATRPAGERVKALENLQLERAGLENELLRSRLARENATPMPPAPVLDVPLKRTMSPKGLPNQEVGSISDKGWNEIRPGVFAPVPSNDVKERIEDNAIQELIWAVRNNAFPSYGALMGAKPKPYDAPPRNKLPRGAKGWKFSVSDQAYEPVY